MTADQFTPAEVAALMRRADQALTPCRHQTEYEDLQGEAYLALWRELAKLGELPEPALHSPPAAVDRRIATERAGQPDSAGLQQDGDDERDAHQDLADGQKGIHESCSSGTLQPRDAIT